jgi:ABC-type multidrug transport system ATPase subunit
MDGSARSAVVLSADGVAHRYGRRPALAPTDLDLRRGEVVALVGPNGAGKSTLLAILAGALRPSEGRVAVAEPPLRIGWVPQRPAQYRHLSPRENLELFARLEGLAEPEAEAARALAEVGLVDERRRSSDLSAGNQQRLNLALGLLGEPEVLLLDEPTASLDPGQRRRFWQLVARTAEGGGAVLFATHDLEESRRAAARLLALVEGRLVFCGTPSEYSEPAAEIAR